MITGFNTDIDYDGITYHVQTEDKGLDTPLILSLVYVGGAILASKRSPYNDLIDSGFDERLLTERLQRQHKLICAAIRAGRIEDLKRMGGRSVAATAPSVDASAKKKSPPAPSDDALLVLEADQSSPEAPQKIAVASSSEAKSTSVTRPPEQIPQSSDFSQKKRSETPFRRNHVGSRPANPSAPKVTGKTRAEAATGGLYFNLLDKDEEFRAGEMATIRIYICENEDGEKPIANAAITLKILGTTFRPIILSAKTDASGLATVRTLLPRFNSGRAAILMRATANGLEAELRRVIHQS